MQIKCESELMKNQKYAQVMKPGIAFDVLQTPDGDALFFSIGTDGVFYVTREVRASDAGWDIIDLSSSVPTSLLKISGEAPIAAKSFAMSQDAQNLNISIALVITICGADRLFFSLDNSLVDSTWVEHIQWRLISFDAASTTPPQSLTIADVYLGVPSQDGLFQNCFVDILRDPTNPFKLLDRFFINPNPVHGEPHWIRHKLQVEMSAGSVLSCLGHRKNDSIPGIYTYGTIGSSQELIFAPQYNVWDNKLPPNAARLQVPSGTTVIASAMNMDGDTNLFVMGTKGIYVFTPDNQRDRATPTLVVPTTNVGPDIFSGVSSLVASTLGKKTVVWGTTSDGEIFNVSCPAGSEMNPSAWTSPIPILNGVLGFAFYLNGNAENNILFAHTKDGNLAQITEDPVSTSWTQRQIMLPATNVDDVQEYDTFTTHISVFQANGVAAPNTAVTLSSTTAVTVYVNNVYYVLMPAEPILTSTDVNGTITIIQETQSLEAAIFHIQLAAGNAVSQDVHPLDKAMNILANIKTGDDLTKIKVQATDGTQRPLISGDVSDTDKEATAQALKQLMVVNESVPKDGSRKLPTTQKHHRSRAVGISLLTLKHPNTWGMSFTDTGIEYFEGDDAMHEFVKGTRHERLAGRDGDPIVLEDFVGSIKVAAGSFFRWLKRVWKKVVKVVARVVEDIWHFVYQIGEEFYEVVLDCIHAVVGAVEFVFNKIKVFFQDLIAWLGFVFNWNDILRTHSVMKNVFKQYGRYAVGSMDTLVKKIDEVFTHVEDEINDWGNLVDPGDTIGNVDKSGSSVPGYHSPQSNWALYHAMNGIKSANSPYNLPDNSKSGLEEIWKDLLLCCQSEEESIKTAVQEVFDQVVGQLDSMTAIEAVKKILAILADLILKSAKTLLITLVEMFKLLIEGILDLLDAPLHIPILSWLYKKISGGNQLSILDLLCLVGAIPVTIIYKVSFDKAPFPDDKKTNALINASDWTALKTVVNGTKLSHLRKHHGHHHHHHGDELPAEQGPLGAELGLIEMLLGVSYFMSTIGTILFVTVDTDAMKAYSGTVLSGLRFGCYILCICPNFIGALQDSQDRPSIINDVVTSLAFAKTAADCVPYMQKQNLWSGYASPIAEAIINAVWFVPSGWWIRIGVASGEVKFSGILSLTGSIFSLIAGLLSILTIKEVDERVRVLAEAAIAGLNLSYAGTSLICGMKTLQGE